VTVLTAPALRGTSIGMFEAAPVSRITFCAVVPSATMARAVVL